MAMERLTTDEFVERAKNTFGDKYDYSLVDYRGIRHKVAIICKCHGVFEQLPQAHLKGHGCRRCFDDRFGESRHYSLEQFVSRAKQVHDEKYDYSKVKYYKSTIRVEIVCPKHGSFMQIPASHLYGKGCPQCARERNSESRRYSQDEFIERAKSVHGDKYDYSMSHYVNGRIPIDIICPSHGLFRQPPNSHLQGIGCPLCNSPHGEREVQMILDMKGIKYERQKKLPGLKYKQPLMLDFYLPEYKIAVEYNGEQHYKEIKFWGGKSGLEIRLKRDRAKQKYCKSNGIKLIEIRYDQDIEQELNKHLQLCTTIL